jgi:hypothetical protein
MWESALNFDPCRSGAKCLCICNFQVKRGHDWTPLIFFEISPISLLFQSLSVESGGVKVGRRFTFRPKVHPQPSTPLVGAEGEHVHKIAWPLTRMGGYLLVATDKAYLPVLRGPRVRIHFPPAESLRTIGTASSQVTRPGLLIEPLQRPKVRPPMPRIAASGDGE